MKMPTDERKQNNTEVLEIFSQPISPHDMSGRGYPVKMAELLA